MTRLDGSTNIRGHQIGASAPERTGIVHFGLGSFHRAHAAVYTALALEAEPGDWGIVGIANRSRKVVDAMAAQDNRYSVVTLDPEREEAGVVDVHRRTLVAAEDGPEVLAAIADPDHRILTLTITETGYHLDPRTGRLDVASPDIAADLENADEPRSPLGQIVRGLMKRHAEGGAPITVLSCDNLLSAGSTTRAAVAQFAEAAGAGAGFAEWLGRSVTFPNAMVDRIVPAPTDATRRAAAAALGVDDACPVPAEPFTMWVIEDDFAAGRPKWEAAGAIFSDEVEKYELVKLRLLNGCHSLIAYLGALDGRETIAASRQQEFVERAVRAAFLDEYLPSIDLPTGFDPDAYLEQLFSRWNNSVLAHRVAQVGSEGSTKLVQRVPIPAIRILERGGVPERLALTVAAWICCVCPPAGFDPGPVAAEMFEPNADALRAATDGAADVRAHALAVVDGGFFPDDLTAHRAFGERVADYVERIVADGVRAAADDAEKRGQR